MKKQILHAATKMVLAIATTLVCISLYGYLVATNDMLLAWLSTTATLGVVGLVLLLLNQKEPAWSQLLALIPVLVMILVRWFSEHLTFTLGGLTVYYLLASIEAVKAFRITLVIREELPKLKGGLLNFKEDDDFNFLEEEEDDDKE